MNGRCLWNFLVILGPDERKSTSGYAFWLGSGVISWSSKKQSCIALSQAPLSSSPTKPMS
jgi:hypothetical protein